MPDINDNDTQINYPLGVRYVSRMDVADRNRYTPKQFEVIGQVEYVPAGNTILRIGETLSHVDHSWCQTMHLVLTPAERDQLIADLCAQRGTETPAGEAR